MECYYKENNEASPKRIGGTGTFTAGNNKTLDLNGLGIPEGALVTAYANVKAGDDSYGDNWFTFSKGWDGEAYFEVTGSAFKTGVFFMEVTDFETNIEDMTAYRLNDAVLSLNNLETEGVYEKIKGLKYFPDLILGHVQGYTQYEKDGNLYFLFTHSTNSKYGYILQTINNSDNPLWAIIPKISGPQPDGAILPESNVWARTFLFPARKVRNQRYLFTMFSET